MKRFKDVIGLLEFEELVMMKEDLNRGGDGMKILVNNKLKEELKKQNQFCAVCASNIQNESETKLSLIVGPKDNEKQVSFCAIDCMEYFLNELKKSGRLKQKQQQE